MKKYAFLLPLLLLTTACSGAGNSDPMDFTPTDIKVYFFESCVYVDYKNPTYLQYVQPQALITKPNDPTSNDPAYNKFIGWSEKPLIMSKKDLWDFDNDHLPSFCRGGKFVLYAQWDYVEK